MPKLMQQLRCCGAVASLGALSVTVSFLTQIASIEFIAFFTLVVIVSIHYLIKTRRNIADANLIVENQILKVNILEFYVFSSDNVYTKSPEKAIEAFISCFGILVDDRVINFNRDGIYIKSIELSSSYITFSYGTDSKTEFIRLIIAMSDKMDLKSLAERLHYETGVFLNIVADNH